MVPNLNMLTAALRFFMDPLTSNLAPEVDALSRGMLSEFIEAQLESGSLLTREGATVNFDVLEFSAKS